MIRVTLAATPQRVAVLIAKAANLAGLTAIAGVAAVVGCLAVGRLMLPATALIRRTATRSSRSVLPRPGAPPAEP